MIKKTDKTDPGKYVQNVKGATQLGESLEFFFKCAFDRFESFNCYQTSERPEYVLVVITEG